MRQSLFRGWKYCAKRTGARSGFSLVELLLTIGIFGILAGLSYSSVAGNMPLWRAKGAADNVIGIFQRARAQAVRSNQWALVSFTGVNTPGSSVITVYIDTNNNGLVDVGTDQVVYNVDVQSHYPSAYVQSVTVGGTASTMVALGPDGTVKPSKLVMPVDVTIASTSPKITQTFTIRVERGGLGRWM
ncbi:MAG: GspH/FimT family pseudopilin [Nitrospinota bacterium]|nr:GspH/FimT family pseudopilin [Nitrospinota bacterium]